MKAVRIGHSGQRCCGPIAPWVHRALPEGTRFLDAEDFDPPFPAHRMGRGYPFAEVEVDGFTFLFSSLHEIDHLIETFRRPILPRYRDAHGFANRHWLSRLPARVKTMKYRRKVLAFLARERLRIEAALGS